MSKRDLKKQIEEQERRLQTLKEQQATSGSSITPEILTEIEEIVATLHTLRTRLKRQGDERWLRWTATTVAVLLLIGVVWLKADLLRLWWLTRCLPDCPGQNLSELDLIEATLRKPGLNEGDLSGANLSETVLHGVDCDQNTHWPESVDLDQAGISCVNEPKEIPAREEAPAEEYQPSSSSVYRGR